jgi:hypothetical protein
MEKAMTMQAIDYRMREQCVYLVNPIQRKRRTLHHATPSEALHQLKLLAVRHNRKVRRLMYSTGSRASGARLEITSVRLPDSGGVGYWHASVWRTP